MRLDRKLDAWREAGLLTAEQAEAIRAHERERSESTSRWAVWALAAAGGLAVAAGVVAVVAANWEEIPDAAKLAAVFAAMLATLYGAARRYGREPSWPFDLLLLVHALLPPAMIGLVAQIYHLSGPPWRTFALCAALALPGAVLSRRGLLTDVALAYAVVAVGSAIEDVAWLRRWLEPGYRLLYLPVVAGLWTLAAARPLARRGARGPAAALRRWAVALIGVPLVVAVGIWHVEAAARPDPDLAGSALWVVAGVVPGAWLLGRRPDVSRLAAGVLGGAYLAALPLAVDGLGATARQFLGFGLFCAFAAALAIAAARAGSRRWVTAATLALAIRAVVFYLELARDLMSTGLGLITTGVVICGVAYGWWRVHRALPVAPRPAEAGPGEAS